MPVRFLLVFFCAASPFATVSVANAGILKSCIAFGHSVINSMEEGKPISEQWIAVKATGDSDLARRWFWRENKKDNALVIGLNIVPPEMVEFLKSVKDWKSLTNADVRSLLRVQGALFQMEFMEAPESTFPEELQMAGATDEDVALWKRLLPGRPLPN